MKFSIGGITPFTCIDYPGQMACVVFTQFCPLGCVYCHNKHLLPIKETSYSVEYLLEFLTQRINLLDAVVFSGGEPLAQDGLIDIIKKIKSMSFKIGIHTSGFYVEKLSEIIPFIDWIGLDIKTLPENYFEITNNKTSGNNAFNSLNLILKSGIQYEVRTTVYPEHFTKEKIFTLTKKLSDLNVKNYVLQEYRPIQENETFIPLKTIITHEDVKELKKMFVKFSIRQKNT